MNFIDTPITPAPRKRKQSKSPRWAMLNEFVDHWMRHLSASAVQVWMVLYRQTNPQGLCCESIKQIADRAGISERSVKRGLKELSEAKLFTRLFKGSLRRGASVRRLSIPPSATSDTSKEAMSNLASATSDTSPEIIKCHQRPTSKCHQWHTPQKVQDRRLPLGAESALKVEKEQDEKALTT